RAESLRLYARPRWFRAPVPTGSTPSAAHPSARASTLHGTPSSQSPGRAPVLHRPRPRSFRATPRQTAQARQERLARLEDLEAAAAEGLVELGRAQIAMLALPEELERHGRQEPAQRPDRRAEPLGRLHLAERREPGRALVRQEDRAAARLQRPATRVEESRRIRMPIQR